jgi:hypothetical protein
MIRIPNVLETREQRSSLLPLPLALEFVHDDDGMSIHVIDADGMPVTHYWLDRQAADTLRSNSAFFVGPHMDTH